MRGYDGVSRALGDNEEATMGHPLLPLQGIFCGRIPVGRALLWISMRSGRLGKRSASSSRDSRFSFFIRW